jgi:hypothetical protein
VITHHFSSGVYAKETRIAAGSWLVQHAHLHSHLSILASGSVELMVDEKISLVHAPQLRRASIMVFVRLLLWFGTVFTLPTALMLTKLIM